MFNTDDRLQTLRAQFKRTARHWSNYGLESVSASPTSVGYRVRTRMVVSDGKLGFYRSGGRAFSEIPTCVVHHPVLREQLGHVRAFLKEHPDVADLVSNVDARTNGESTLLTFCSVIDNQAALAPLEALAGDTVGVGLNLTEKPTSAIMVGTQFHLAGPSTIALKIGESQFDVPATVFLQVNPAVAADIQAVVADAFADVVGTGPIVDAYCGIGSNTAGLKSVWGFDVNADSVAVAQAVSPANTYVAMDDDAAAAELTAVAPVGIVVNPGRSGMSANFLQSVGQSTAQRIVYVSCFAPTLLRDADSLRAFGFRKSKVMGFEMMPRTNHLEVVTIFERDPDLDTSIPVTSWRALVDGLVNLGTLPGLTEGQVCRVVESDRFERQSVITIESNMELPAIRQRLRAWKRPAVGDRKFGDRQTRRWFSRKYFVNSAMIYPEATSGFIDWVAEALSKGKRNEGATQSKD